MPLSHSYWQEMNMSFTILTTRIEYLYSSIYSVHTYLWLSVRCSVYMRVNNHMSNTNISTIVFIILSVDLPILILTPTLLLLSDSVSPSPNTKRLQRTQIRNNTQTFPLLFITCCVDKCHKYYTQISFISILFHIFPSKYKQHTQNGKMTVNVWIGKHNSVSSFIFLFGWKYLHLYLLHIFMIIYIIRRNNFLFWMNSTGW